MSDDGLTPEQIVIKNRYIGYRFEDEGIDTTDITTMSGWIVNHSAELSDYNAILAFVTAREA